VKRSTPKDSKAELAELLRQIVRDVGAGVPARDLPEPFNRAWGLCVLLDHGITFVRGVYGPDDKATKYWKKRGEDVEGLPFVESSTNPRPPDVQSARVRAVRASLMRLQDGTKGNQKPDPDDLAALSALADALDAGEAQEPAKAVAGGPKNSDLPRKIVWLAGALVLVQDHPEKPDAEIARAVGVHPSTLCRNQAFRRAAAMARAPDLPHGQKIDGRVEAYSDAPED